MDRWEHFKKADLAGLGMDSEFLDRFNSILRGLKSIRFTIRNLFSLGYLSKNNAVNDFLTWYIIKTVFTLRTEPKAVTLITY